MGRESKQEVVSKSWGDEAEPASLRDSGDESWVFPPQCGKASTELPAALKQGRGSPGDSACRSPTGSGPERVSSPTGLLGMCSGFLLWLPLPRTT